MNTIYILGILIFLLYIYYNPKNIENFNSGVKPINSDDLYRENHDLNYMVNRTNMQVTSEENVQTQRMAPINTPGNGKDPYPETVDAQDLLPSSRIPDELSDDDNYTIPMPKFDDLQNTIRYSKQFCFKNYLFIEKKIHGCHNDPLKRIQKVGGK